MNMEYRVDDHTQAKSALEGVIERMDRLLNSASTTDMQERTALFDDLNQYLMHTFGADLPSEEEVRVLWDQMNTTQTLDLHTLVSLRPSLVPIAVVKYVLGIKRIDIVPGQSKSWRDFVRKYSIVLPYQR